MLQPNGRLAAAPASVATEKQTFVQNVVYKKAPNGLPLVDLAATMQQRKKRLNGQKLRNALKQAHQPSAESDEFWAMVSGQLELPANGRSRTNSQSSRISSVSRMSTRSRTNKAAATPNDQMEVDQEPNDMVVDDLLENGPIDEELNGNPLENGLGDEPAETDKQSDPNELD